MPFVRFYTWDTATISVGCNQNPEKRLDLDLCRKENIPVVRRPTGGRELLHGHDLCYCAAIPLDKPVSGVDARRIFAEINDILIAGLREMGIQAQWGAFMAKPRLVNGPCFAQAESGEITVSGKKLMASAQRVFPRCIIQEGSMPLYRTGIDLAQFMICGDREEIRRRMRESSAYFFEEAGDIKGDSALVVNFRKAFEIFYNSLAGPWEMRKGESSRNN